ncbi:MAG: tetratricopeptide repeat protein [Spirochaetia bacterium]|nr:tetratricopeptide repeat protein [Spirochaetia bacterium]
MGLTFCSTTLQNNNQDKTDISNSIDQDTIILEKVRLLIEDGSLTSLTQVITILETEKFGMTEQGEYQKFIAGSLLRLVFPISDRSNIRIISPKSGMLTQIVDKALEGKIIEIPNEDVNFFTLLLSSTAALYTESEAVMEKSLDILTTIYSVDSNSYLPIYIRSFLFENQNKYKQAFEGYLESLERDSFSYPSEFGIIRILINNGDYSKALSHLENVQNKYSQHKELKYLLVDALIGNKELDKALSIVSQALALDPDETVMTLKYADIMQQQGEDSRALYMLGTIETAVGESPESIRIRASILLKSGEYKQALLLIENAVKDFPDDSLIREIYGRILFLTGRDGEGREYLENSLKTNPDSLVSLQLLTEEAIGSGSWVRASEFIVKILEKSISDVFLRYAVEIYQNLGNIKKALEYNFIIINDGNPFYNDFHSAVNMLLREGNNKDAGSYIDDWISNSNNTKDKSYFYYLKSLVLTDNKDKLDVLRQSLFENLQNFDSILAIADAYYELGEKRSSYRYLKQALILEPENDYVKKKLRTLEKEL